MIISEAANEPLLHIRNTNNRPLNQKWQARLVTGRGLVACCCWTSAEINPGWITFTPSIRKYAFGKKTSTCQCSKMLQPQANTQSPANVFCLSMQRSPILPPHNIQPLFKCDRSMQQEPWGASWWKTHKDNSFPWLKYLLLGFCVFFIMLGFSVGNREKR